MRLAQLEMLLITESIVLFLQREALKLEESVVSLLRTAKVIATKLNFAEALVWIDHEPNGCQVSELIIYQPIAAYAGHRRPRTPIGAGRRFTRNHTRWKASSRPPDLVKQLEALSTTS